MTNADLADLNDITVQSPAKINLFLHITGRRADGYHNLQTVFRLIDFYDTIRFVNTHTPNMGQLPVHLTNADTITQNPNDNLIVKASLALLDFVKNQNLLTQDERRHLPIIHIHLDKKIPMGAGLGGGSSNCATTLMTLNDIWQLGLSNEQLRQIGATLGADVPIFIFGKDAIAEGIGEILTPIDLPPQQFLLLTPNAHINTKQLFANDNLQRNYPTFSHEFLQQNSKKFTENLSQDFYNVFEPVVTQLSVDVNDALLFLQKIGKITNTTPRMTGSGSCVFLPLPSDVDNIQRQNWQSLSPCASFVVKTV